MPEGEVDELDEDKKVWTAIGEMQGQIKEVRDAVFGYFIKTDGGQVRVKGLLENQTDLITQFTSWKEGLMHFGWAIGKPVLGMLAVLVALGVISCGIVIYLLIHGGLALK